jgi:hypothetical protein
MRGPLSAEYKNRPRVEKGPFRFESAEAEIGLQYPLQYGYGTMYFKLPWFINMVMKVPPLWGHSGTTGSFLYYSEGMNLYMAGSINQVDSKIKPFRLMGKVIKAIDSKW